MGRKEKAESIGSTRCLERGWENPSPTSGSIVTASGCGCQGDCGEGKSLPLASAFPVSSVSGPDMGAWVRGGLFRWLCPSAIASAVSVSGLWVDPSSAP